MLGAEEKRLDDITLAAETIIKRVQFEPNHVRQWLRGVKFEAERVLFEITNAKRRASRRFLALQGLEPEPMRERD